jgi:catechol 2,3-dioxygenase-like lactoylglutathione lyase family enzyme
LPKTQLKVIGIDHVVLHVRDLARSRKFYVEVLGFQVIHDTSWQSFLVCGSQQLGLFEAKPDEPVHAGSAMNHLAFRLAEGDHAGVKATLEGAGIQVTGRPGDDDCLYFDDPDGHRLQLLTPGDPG